MIKESACNVGDLGSIPESGRSPGEENDNPLQCSCLENSMDRAAWQAPPSMASSRQEYWHGLPFLSPGDLPDSGIKSGFPALQVDSSPSEAEVKIQLHFIFLNGHSTNLVPLTVS